MSLNPFANLMHGHGKLEITDRLGNPLSSLKLFAQSRSLIDRLLPPNLVNYRTKKPPQNGVSRKPWCFSDVSKWWQLKYMFYVHHLGKWQSNFDYNVWRVETTNFGLREVHRIHHVLRGLLPHVLHSGGPVDPGNPGRCGLKGAPGVGPYTLEDEWLNLQPWAPFLERKRIWTLQTCRELCCMLIFRGVSNLEISDKSDSIDLSIPIFELMEGNSGMGLSGVHGHGV